MIADEPNPTKKSRLRTVFVIDHPYCVRRMADGKYVLMNRDYRPLGYKTTECAHPEAGDFYLPELTPEIAEKISIDNKSNTDDIYLYNDGCNPMSGKKKHMDAYLERLDVLRQILPLQVSACSTRAKDIERLVRPRPSRGRSK